MNRMETTMEKEKSRRFEVFCIREYTQDRQIKALWTKLGTAFENSDGSWNLRLHALPLTNPKTGLAELHMREPRPQPADEQEKTSESFVYTAGVDVNELI